MFSTSAMASADESHLGERAPGFLETAIFARQRRSPAMIS